jgi:hypothetical protein
VVVKKKITKWKRKEIISVPQNKVKEKVIKVLYLNSTDRTKMLPVREDTEF